MADLPDPPLPTTVTKALSVIEFLTLAYALVSIKTESSLSHSAIFKLYLPISKV